MAQVSDYVVVRDIPSTLDENNSNISINFNIPDLAVLQNGAQKPYFELQLIIGNGFPQSINIELNNALIDDKVYTTPVQLVNRKVFFDADLLQIGANEIRLSLGNQVTPIVNIEVENIVIKFQRRVNFWSLFSA